MRLYNRAMDSATPPRALRSYVACGGVAVLLIAAAEASWIQFHRAVPGTGNAIDLITVNESRFRELKTMLPPRGVVGYVGDLDLSGPEGTAWYMAAQYSLAPVQLAPGTDHVLVVGNLSDPSAASSLSRGAGFETVRDFGRGVLLLRRIRK